MSLRLRDQFFESSRGRIVDRLRRGGLTVDELTSALGLTDNAVRVQLASMERDGLVRRTLMRRGPTRPSNVFELTPELEQLLSRAYMPLLTQLIRTCAEREPPEEFDALMREAGRGLARDVAPQRPDGPLAARVAAASRFLNTELGALTEVERSDDHLVIRGHGCPLAALTGKHPGVCHAIESLLAEMLGARVAECCDRKERPRCCFHVHPPAADAGPAPAHA
jgi:DeoR family transcriptional regulator, suf operon transcriptional repressor